LAVRVERDRGVVSYQMMTCHSADAFRKSIARLGAKERLMSKPITIEVADLPVASSHEISKAIMRHIADAKPCIQTADNSGNNILSAIKSIFSLAEKHEGGLCHSHTIPKRARDSARMWLRKNCEEV